ncbi:MAG TPA: lytic transglycosylase domain-containing protein [Thermoanaerobaculia bacterium]|nr:lytic transglycosylase domain-containing protein [Thermoanaerobaculia bacterium]
MFGPKTAATLALGTVLSAGGVADAVDNVQSLLQKDARAVIAASHHRPGALAISAVTGGVVLATGSVLDLPPFPDRFPPRAFSIAGIDMKSGQPGNLAGLIEDLKRGGGRRHVFFSRDTAFGDLIHEKGKKGDERRRQFFSREVPFGELIHNKARKYDVDPALVAAVMEAESDFQKRARSPVGARGLMQIMPDTGRKLGAGDLYDPEQNIDAGVRYIKYLQGRFGGDLKKTVAAYNAGEGNVERYGGVPPFQETRQYVKRVMSRYHERSAEAEAYR